MPAGWRGQVPFVVVVAVLALSLVVLLFSPDHPEPGIAGIAVSALLAAVLRLCLPTARAGFLAVRARWVDALVLAGLGVVVLVLDIRLRG